MTPQELTIWLINHRAELEDFCSYAQHWRKGRERRRIHTLNDDRYDQFLTTAADLIQGLDELGKMAEQGWQGQQEDEEG
jgi:hypothetical protein